MLHPCVAQRVQLKRYATASLFEQNTDANVIGLLNDALKQSTGVILRSIL